ncbi:MAG TPA: SWIM zinc finger family protein [Vicinamibacteria bacterium]
MKPRFFEEFPPSRPREVKGGIRARSRRGAFGRSWWARRWIAVLESLELGGRLGRGRSYARRGQVLSIAIDKGRVEAVVQGSRPEPYQVTLQVETLSAAAWQRVVAALAGEVRFAASLLAGEMPPDVEEAFRAAGLSLFPMRREDLHTGCSCPDWSNPCKHIAAVYYLLGEEFDRDPFLIFRLRGLDRDELVRLLDRAAATSPAPAPGKAETASGPPEPLPPQPSDFWRGRELPEGFLGEVEVAPVSAALLGRLGQFPFWRGREPIADALAPAYRDAAALGLDAFLGEASRMVERIKS